MLLPISGTEKEFDNDRILRYLLLIRLQREWLIKWQSGKVIEILH